MDEPEFSEEDMDRWHIAMHQTNVMAIIFSVLGAVLIQLHWEGRWWGDGAGVGTLLWWTVGTTCVTVAVLQFVYTYRYWDRPLQGWPENTDPWKRGDW